MNGKAFVLCLLLAALAAGGVLYYLQIYGFYYEVADHNHRDVVLLSQSDSRPIEIETYAFQAVDAMSSPIRYRACFMTSVGLEELRTNYVAAAHAVPRNAPTWFDCFDAAKIAAALDNKSAAAFIGQKNFHFGVDRIVVITEDGRGYVWHDLNDCGKKSYDGTNLGEDCPEVSG